MRSPDTYRNLSPSRSSNGIEVLSGRLDDIILVQNPIQIVLSIDRLSVMTENVSESATKLLVPARQNVFFAGMDTWGLAGAVLYVSSVLMKYPLTQLFVAERRQRFSIWASIRRKIRKRKVPPPTW